MSRLSIGQITPVPSVFLSILIAFTTSCHGRSAQSHQGNSRSERALTPLIIAVKNRDTRAVERLLASGAEVNAKDNKGYTALEYAAYNGDLETVKALLAAKADVNSRSSDGYTALHSAAHCGDPQVVQTLLAAGANINARTSQGITPLLASLDMACGKPEITLALIGAGADVNAVDSNGDSALWIATTESSSRVLEALLKKGANPNTQSESKGFRGDTPLHLAAMNGLGEATRLLLQYGAKTTIRNAQGQTPLEVASPKQPEIRKLLLAR